jgi:heterodisulfide reductase subunit A
MPESEHKQEMAPRVGVFICSCGEELSKLLELSAVEADCRKVPGVVFAGIEPYPCSRPGLAAMREVIKENSLDRAVIAGCTPRLHGRLFADACEKAGLNRWLVGFANIREHCGRVHNDKVKATEKAKDLVRAAVSTVSRARPLESIKITPFNSVLVIGGGISGLTVAANLAHLGHEVTLLEKGDTLGGNLAKVSNVYPLARSGNDLVKSAVAAVEGKVEILTRTTLSTLWGGPGQFFVTLGPGGATGGAGGSGDSGSAGGGSSRATQAGASAARSVKAGGGARSGLQARAGERAFGAIVVATGGDWVSTREILVALQEAGPTGCDAEDEYLRGSINFYCKLPAFTGRVLTQAELESELEKNALKSVRSVMFVNFSRGVPSHTRVNTLVGLKNAIVLKQANPATEVTFIFDRIPSEYERDFLRARDHGVKFFRNEGAEAPDFTLNGLRLKGAHAGGAERVVQADLVVIPTIAVPSAETRRLAGVLRIPMDSGGLFIEPHIKLRPGDFAERGIFVIGASHGPVTVFECVAQASEAAARASRFLHTEVVRAPFESLIDRRVCRGCSRCANACEWDAIEMVTLENGLKLAVVDEGMCTGCGVCAMVCICGAPTLAPVHRGDVRAMVGAMFD